MVLWLHSGWGMKANNKQSQALESIPSSRLDAVQGGALWNRAGGLGFNTGGPWQNAPVGTQFTMPF